jgi:hypothetical protein
MLASTALRRYNGKGQSSEELGRPGSMSNARTWQSQRWVAVPVDMRRVESPLDGGE